jgi:hypothetical protein
MVWNEKQILRVKMRAMMRSVAGKASASEQIRHHLRKSAAWQAARVVFGFVALPGEPDWLGEDLPVDKQIAFPRIAENGMLLFFSGSTFEIGALGVVEPVGGTAASSPDLVIVPPAFDPTERAWKRERILRQVARGQPSSESTGCLFQVSDSGKRSLGAPRCACWRDSDRGGIHLALSRW